MDSPSKMSSYLETAVIDPQILLKGKTPRLVDEWQLAPNLWDAARYEIDWRSELGQFIFTGSSVPVDSDSVIDSGAGRFSWLTMRPMSLYESGESNGDMSLRELFNRKEKVQGQSSSTLRDIAYYICRGGWPQLVDLKPQEAISIPYDYYNAIIKSDINRADGVRKNPERVKNLMRSYARNICTQATNITRIN